ncbi:hypothetical protein [Clostridium perfringens]|uniref:hypothetical protein n=1 Tax=Clostridium perfringens TaxID=1502 RepID=UPI0024BCE6EE|nr:hypothetical protein [Clostridium perfringens]
MKIWEGYLTLEYDYNKDDFYTWFGFTQSGKDFILEENNKEKYWISEDRCDTLPYKIETLFGDTFVSQGFDRELSEKEQELLEIKMKVCLKEYLRKENEKINKIYENKIKAINMKR